MSLDDELSKIVGESDQAGAAFATMGGSWAIFFNQLVKDGLTREEAIALTLTAAREFFKESFRKSP